MATSDRAALGGAATVTNMTKQTRPKTNKVVRRPNDVIAEIRRRHGLGHPLKSGANRGDWLYAAATKRFGSWGAAVEAAGFDYPKGLRPPLADSEARHLTHCECFSSERRPDPLTKDEVLSRIREAAARGEPLRVTRDTLLASGARHHFGTWKAGIKAAGIEWSKFPKWTAEAVVARIREDISNGLSVYATDVIAREETLYQSARRRFGSWGAALEEADPSLPPPRQGRPRVYPVEAVAKKGRTSKSR